MCDEPAKGYGGKVGVTENGNDEPASAKEISYLRRLGVKEIPTELKKKQASKMIDQALEHN